MIKRRVVVGTVAACGLALLGLAPGCSGAGEPTSQVEKGTLALPLTAHAPSGVKYRLRDATFRIYDEDEYYGGWGGDGAGSSTIVVSSEDDPDAENISLSLERGYYFIDLDSGWRMERIDESGATEVEATLLSGSRQWVYVAERSTRWVEFSFGIGGREVWLNGQLNIGINVYDDPDQYYGAGGFGTGGSSGTAGLGAGGMGD